MYLKRDLLCSTQWLNSINFRASRRCRVFKYASKGDSGVKWKSIVPLVLPIGDKRLNITILHHKILCVAQPRPNPNCFNYDSFFHNEKYACQKHDEEWEKGWEDTWDAYMHIN